MTYAVKEIFYTLQGEGANAGRPAVFCRFTGCNLWTGREKDRATAVCTFCDTDFVGTDGTGGGKFRSRGGAGGRRRREVAQGERTLPTARGLHRGRATPPGRRGARHGVPRGRLRDRARDQRNAPATCWDLICVSPKAGSTTVLLKGNELKLVYPQAIATPERFESAEFENFFLQPMDGPDVEENTARTIEYCLEHPQWRLSLQTHKIVGIR